MTPHWREHDLDVYSAVPYSRYIDAERVGHPTVLEAIIATVPLRELGYHAQFCRAEINMIYILRTILIGPVHTQSIGFSYHPNF